MSSAKSIVSWRGRNLEDYTKDELIEIFRELSTLIDTMQKSHAADLDSLAKMNRGSKISMARPSWKVICDSLRNDPESWRATRYVLTHESGIALYIAVGLLFLGVDEDSRTDVHLGLFGRWKVWRAYKAWKRWQLTRILESERPGCIFCGALKLKDCYCESESD